MSESTPQAEREVAALLAQLREDPPDDGFELTLARRLAAIQPRPSRLQRWRQALRMRPVLSGSLAGAAVAGATFSALIGFWGMPGGHASNASFGEGYQAEGVLATNDPRDVSASGMSSAASPGQACAPPEAVAGQDGGVLGVPRADVFVIPEGKVALVQLQFDVDTAVESAEFSVLLPPGLAFYSDGQALPERVFRWVAPLRAGSNLVPVAVMGEVPGEHRLTAMATVGSQVVVHEIVLDVGGRA